MTIIYLLTILSQLNFSNPIDITEKCLFLSPKLITSYCCGNVVNSHQELVFREQKEFLKFKNEICHCSFTPDPEIDFSKYILLLKWSKGTFCDNDYRRKVKIDELNKRIIYSIPQTNSSDCTLTTQSWHGNYVLVPITSREYIVEFEVNNTTKEPNLKSQELDSLRSKSYKLKNQVDSLSKLLNEINSDIDLFESVILDSFSTRMITDYESEIEVNGILTYTIGRKTQLYTDHDEKKESLISIPEHSQIRAFKRYGKFIYVKYRMHQGWVIDDFILTHHNTGRGIEMLKDERPRIPEFRKQLNQQ